MKRRKMMIEKIDNELWRSRDNITKVAMIKEKINEIVDFINNKMLAIVDKPVDTIIQTEPEIVVEEKAEPIVEEQPKKRGRR